MARKILNRKEIRQENDAAERIGGRQRKAGGKKTAR